MAEYQEAGEWPPLPDCHLHYLVEHLFDVGPGVPGGMGDAPIGWQDMLAWQQMTGFELQPWEARLLRSLSGSYLSEAHRAEDPAHPMPWLEMERIIERRGDVSRKIAAVFGGLVRKG